MKKRQSFKLILIKKKDEGDNLSLRENEKKKKDMGFARREAEMKHKA